MRHWPIGVLSALLGFAAAPALAHKVKSKTIELDHPWVRMVPGEAKSAAGYVKITNTGKTDDRLIGVSLDGAGAGELQGGTGEAGSMVEVTGGIRIPAGGTVALEAGGAHIMFSKLRSELESDSYADGSLTFEKAGRMPIEFYVEAAPDGSGSGSTGADAGSLEGQHSH
jgi:copper(I)-binding protein